MKELIGKKILKIEIDRGKQHFLKFTTDSSECVFFAEGDCCSESWFYGFNGILSLVGSTVTSVTEVPLGEAVGYRGRQDFTRKYCIKIVSTGGHTDIEFRNSSNGYYGGEVVFVTNKKFYKKVLWRKIEDDITF